MKETVVIIVGVILFFATMFCAIEYEHNATMECAKFAMEKQYSASDIRAICWK